MRNRSGSVKWKSDEGYSYAHVANRAVASNNGVLSAGNLEELNFNISSVTSLCDKIDGSLSTADDGPVKTVLQDISKAIRLVNKNHEVIARNHNEKSISVPVSRPVPDMVNLGTIPKKTEPIQSPPWIRVGGGQRT
jgi:hypothetical protein